MNSLNANVVTNKLERLFPLNLFSFSVSPESIWVGSRRSPLKRLVRDKHSNLLVQSFKTLSLVKLAVTE
jgi:hypothetical protein